MAIIDNLVAYWALDEASGNALDSHASYPLTEQGTCASVSGKVSTAREVSNPNYFTHADHADFSIGNTSFTMAGWFRLTNLDSLGIVMAKDTGGTREYGCYVGVDGVFHFFIFDAGDTGPDIVWGSSLSTATWHHVVMGYDATADVSFLSINNGTRVTSSSHTTGVKDAGNAFALGARSDGTLPLAGYLDEVGFWNGRALDTTEQAWLYNSGAGRSYADIVAASASGQPTTKHHGGILHTGGASPLGHRRW